MSGEDHDFDYQMECVNCGVEINPIDDIEDVPDAIEIHAADVGGECLDYCQMVLRVNGEFVIPGVSDDE